MTGFKKIYSVFERKPAFEFDPRVDTGFASSADVNTRN
jgi:hypothetical protein